MTIATAVIGAVLLTFGLLASALHYALRSFSRYRLAELLDARGWSQRLDPFLADVPLLILTTATARMLSSLGLMLLVVYWFEGGFPPETWWDTLRVYGGVFATAGAVILVFNVAIPNAWSRYAPEALLAPCVPAMHALHFALTPLVRFLHLFDGLVRRLIGAPRIDAANGADQIGREILDAVSEGELKGAVDEEEKEMIESIMEFRERQVGSIMTPRTEIVAVRAECTFDEARQAVIEAGHSRLPVYQETIDEILGVLYAKDLIGVHDAAGFDVRGILRKVPFIPESKLLRDLLHDFQEQNVHLAIVLDEYGGTAGIVTIEDILEELVGEITDEYETPEPEPVQRLDETTAIVDARVSIEELNDEMEIQLPESDDYETVGGFVFSHLGKIPQSGEEFDYENVRIRVLEAEPRRVRLLQIKLLTEALDSNT